MPQRGDMVQLERCAWMHSHDRTLLARLGFLDPDKKNQRHDLACRYIASNAAAFIALAKRLDLEIDEVQFHLERPIVKGEGAYSTVIGFIDVEAAVGSKREFSVRHKLEGAPTRGITHLRGHLLIEVKITREDVGAILRQFALYRTYWGRAWVGWDHRSMLGKSPLDGTLPRRDTHYGPEHDWWDGWYSSGGPEATKWQEDISFALLFVDWRLSKSEVAELRKARIIPIRLGSAFEEFCSSQAEEVGLLEL